ncbi:hypothetical protein V8F06_009117 [Rhypophila decipiens]
MSDQEPAKMLMSTQGPAAMYAATILLTILNCIVVPLRFYRRRVGQKQAWRMDDWLTIPALLTVTFPSCIGVSWHAVGYPTPPMTPAPDLGTGNSTDTSVAQHSPARIMTRTPLEQANEIISKNEKIFFIVFSLFAASLSCSKASILFLYRRIFCSDSLLRNFTLYIVWFLLVIVALFGIGITLAHVFACGTQFHYWWSSAGADLRAHCADTQTLTYAHSVSGFIIDVLLMAIPIVPVWRMHLPLGRKLGVMAVFLTGGVALAASLIRMIWFLWENQTPWNTSFDQDLLASTFLFWTVMETHVALLAACLPTLRGCLNNLERCYYPLRLDSNTYNGTGANEKGTGGSENGKSRWDSTLSHHPSSLYLRASERNAVASNSVTGTELKFITEWSSHASVDGSRHISREDGPV